ncbi:hypothetical protein KY289_008372 [Solanum tuberosum]|nr:hypothetical protein KY289_008372 [Solanum tuberosum]
MPGLLTDESTAFLLKWKTKWIKIMKGRGDCYETMLSQITMGCNPVGKQNEDPTSHLMDFNEIMNTFHYNGASDDAIYLRTFPFSLKDDAKIWLQSLPSGSIRTWDERTTKFLDKYFSPAKTTRMRKEISNFSQLESKTMVEAWERFKELLRKCPHNGIEPWLHGRTNHEAIEILNELAEDANQWVVENSERKKIARVHQVDTYNTLQAQIAAIAKDVKHLTLAQAQMTQSIMCDFCAGRHPTHECQHGAFIEEEVGQTANQISERPPANLPSDTLRNPKELKVMKREKLDKYFGKFLEMLKQLHVNIPFTELADQSTIIPEGIIEDVLVRVGKFVFPVDFIVVDMEENKEENVVFNMKKVDELTFKTTKSDKKIMAWVCALGQACTRVPNTISDTD